jgi:hypothetical protein
MVRVLLRDDQNLRFIISYAVQCACRLPRIVVTIRVTSVMLARNCLSEDSEILTKIAIMRASEYFGRQVEAETWGKWRQLFDFMKFLPKFLSHLLSPAQAWKLRLQINATTGCTDNLYCHALDTTLTHINCVDIPPLPTVGPTPGISPGEQLYALDLGRSQRHVAFHPSVLGLNYPQSVYCLEL